MAADLGNGPDPDPCARGGHLFLFNRAIHIIADDELEALDITLFVKSLLDLSNDSSSGLQKLRLHSEWL